MMIQAMALVVLSAGIVYVSRRSLSQPRSHGFFRFWAWEAIAGLIVLAGPHWFRAPFSWHQIISWLLLVTSVLPVVLGLRELSSAKRNREEQRDLSLLEFEKTTELVTSGLYGYIRHPMYCSLLLLAWGVFFKAMSWSTGVLVALGTLFLVVTARIEEREDIAYFGTAYETYMRRTKLFIPFVW